MSLDCGDSNPINCAKRSGKCTVKIAISAALGRAILIFQGSTMMLQEVAEPLPNPTPDGPPVADTRPIPKP